jgi:hypothetical protein
MLMPQPMASSSSSEKQLRQLFKQLSAVDQQSLLSFAEFLVSRTTITSSILSEFPAPEAIERPTQESVVKAIKRLTATYPMIARDLLLNETSALMSAHVIQGRTAVDIIDELERVFAKHYQQLKQQFEQTKVGDVS